MRIHLRRRPSRSSSASSSAASATWLPLALGIALALPAVSWLVGVDHFRTHDGDLHLWRAWEFWQVWQSGQAPPRWAPDLTYGLGSPVFTYYNPLVYVLAGVIQAWGLGAAVAVKVVGGVALLLGASGTCSLALALARPGQAADGPPSARVGSVGNDAARWAALLAGLAYLYAPYVLANVARRGALAEALALGLAPWLLWAELRCLRRPDPGSLALLALVAAAFGLSHNLTVAMVAPLAIGLALWWLLARLASWRERADAALRLALAAALGLALSAFYWLPAFGELALVQIERDLGPGGAPTYARHFVELPGAVSLQPIHDYRSDDLLGLAQVAAVLAGVVVVATRRPTAGRILLLGGAALTLVLSSPASRVIWEAVPLLGYFQFPWRLLGAFALLGALLAGSLALASRRSALVALLVGGGLVLGGSWLHVEPVEWRADWESAVGLREHERQTELVGLTSNDEFLPAWVERDRHALFDPAAAPDEPSASLSASLLDAQPTRWALDVDAGPGSTLALDAFYFPTWRATVDGRPAPTRPSGELGLLGVEIPPGRHRVEVYVAPMAIERIADALSLAGALLLALLVAPALRNRRSRPWLASSALLAALVLAPFAASGLAAAPTARFVPAEVVADDGPAKLLGLRVDDSRLGRTGKVDLALLFLASEAPPAVEPAVSLRLTDPEGRVLAERSHPLGQGLRPTTLWRPGLLLTDRFEWRLPPGFAGGRLVLHAGIGGGPLHRVAALDLASGEPIGTSAAASDSVVQSEWPAVVWDGRVRLEHAAIGRLARESSAGGRAPGYRAALTWRRLVAAESALAAVFRVRDSRGTVEREVATAIPFNPGEARAQQVVRLPLPADALPGRYYVDLLVRDPEGVALDAEPTPSHPAIRTWVPLATLDVPPEGDRLPASAAPLDADFGEGLRAVGYERRLAGDVLDVVVYWKADRPLAASYTLFVHLLDRDGRLVDQLDGLPYDGAYPTSEWWPGRVVPFAARLRLPERGGPFRLRAGLYARPGGEPRVAAGRPYVSLGLIDRALAPHGPALEAGEGVTLLAHRVEREGDQVTLVLYWRASRPVPAAYSVFVHAVDSAGQIVAQGDGPPELGERTTVDWPPGETIVDPHRLTLPPGSAARFRVGLYRLADGRRLPLASGGDYVDLEAMP